MIGRVISAALRNQVIDRAQNRCEYCGLSHLGQEATFHIDHIHPVSAGGRPFQIIWLWHVFYVLLENLHDNKRWIQKRRRWFRYFTHDKNTGISTFNGGDSGFWGSPRWGEQASMRCI